LFAIHDPNDFQLVVVYDGVKPQCYDCCWVVLVLMINLLHHTQWTIIYFILVWVGLENIIVFNL